MLHARALVGHGSTIRSAEIEVLSERPCVSVERMAPRLTVRTAQDSDWPAMAVVAATCFGSWRAQETTDMWRTLIPADGAVVACDGEDVVGTAFYLDLQL